MSKLALLGGKPIRKELYPAYNTIGAEEKLAVSSVLDTGNLSQFLGAWHDDFFGGPKVREFEENWAQITKAQYAISVNSNTSGLITAMGAIGIKPGDEVIVSPYSMTASAIAPLMYGAVPVFADIDPDTFCISPESFKKSITSRTKAIIIVHIFGQPGDMDEILSIASSNHILVVEDCAQAPLSTYKGKNIGTLGCLGVFSLNYHKHIHTGEGGVITTNDEELAKRCRLIRNHGENVVEHYSAKELLNTQGFNFRMPEIEAAIGIEQLKKLPNLIEERIALAREFTKRTIQYPGITPPYVREGNRHVYYFHTNKWDSASTGLHRDTFVKALLAEIPTAKLRETTPLIGAGYVKPLYLQPIYQNKSSSCAFNCPRYSGTVNYSKGLCPVTETMHFEKVFTHEYMRPIGSRECIEDFFRALDKIYSNLNVLIDWEHTRR